MPVYWITSICGSVNFKVQADDPTYALDLLGRSLKYSDFAAMCDDLHYSLSDFQIGTVAVEPPPEYDEEGNRKRIAQERENSVVGAFKALRRATIG